MRLFNFMLPEDLDVRIKAESRESGVPMSEIMRRAVDEYLERKERNRAENRRERVLTRGG